MLKPDYIIEGSWEVCNKIGGIYTVLATRANTMQQWLKDKVIFVGPDLKEHSDKTFRQDDALLASWQKQAKQDGLHIRVGRWMVPGEPIAVLVDFRKYYDRKNEIFLHIWEDYGVDSLHAYGDYDESCMFGYGVAKTVESFYHFLEAGEQQEADSKTASLIFQAHEWMLGVALLYVNHYLPGVATIFTTHATTVGRSIAGNGKQLYGYLPGYYGDQMARELNVESKHSIEKHAALNADAFTTVSAITARECMQLLGRQPDQLLLNGFEDDFVPAKSVEYDSKRFTARRRLLDIAARLTGSEIDTNALIVSIGGRYEFRNKGIDVFIDALNQLRHDDQLHRQVLAFINVPAWVAAPREDLQQALNATSSAQNAALACPYLTHWLHNMETDQVLNKFNQLGIHNLSDDRVKFIFIPCYLDGNDGIVNLSYYDTIVGNDLCIFPSYYEPWGYTPLEAVAFSVPCVTTDLAGFGIWAREEMQKAPIIENGVEVIHRTDNNYKNVTDAIADAVKRFAALSPQETERSRKEARALSKKALWQHFFTWYEQAYDLALRKAEIRIGNNTQAPLPPFNYGL